MAGTKPTFLTGANAKIRLNGKTLAFCQDFSCSIQIVTRVPKVLGKYEGDSVEPLGYMVSGGFTVIRYVKDIQKALGPGAYPHGLTENDAGNGVGNWGGQWGGWSPLGTLSRLGVGNDGRAHEALDPSRFGNGTTFDIQVYQKVPKSGLTGESSPQNILRRITDALSGDDFVSELVNEQEGNSSTVDYLGVLNIKKARITQVDFSLNKRSAALERFSFVALYVDGDGFVANASGT